MSVTAIARRYAEALADVAIAHNQVEQIDAEVGAFARHDDETAASFTTCLPAPSSRKTTSAGC